MKTDCDVVRDLLPLYADDACSQRSRELVEEHLPECPDCRAFLEKLRRTEIEAGLQAEKVSVLRFGERRLRRRSAVAGAVVAGVLMVPVLVCLIVNMATGHALDWFFIVLAALLTAASLTVVPLMAPEDKLFWTFAAFCASLTVLLAVTCLYARGDWFWVASAAALFGLAAVFLPFAAKARPARRLLGGARRWLVVLAADAALFIHMMNMIAARGGFTGRNAVMALGTLAGFGLAALEIMRKRGTVQ